MVYKYKFKENNIVLDVNSGAVHTVEEIVYDILDFYKIETEEAIIEKLKDKYSRTAILEAVNDIRELESAGMLYSDDSHISMEMLEQKEPVIKAMCLHVAHDCNMKCRYCFGDQGAFEGERSLMPFDIGKKAIDFLIERSGTRRNLEIDFFGGEPLMNFEVVKQLVEYGRSIESKFGKCIRFTITTNGILLDDEKADYINGCMDNVILSIDGRPEVNDNMRKTSNGKGTYKTIVRNFKKFVDKRDGLYYVRGTFTKENLDFSNDVAHLSECGFNSISVEPVVLPASVPFALDESDLDKIMEEYDRLADLCIEKEKKGKTFEFFHFNIDLEQGPCVIKRLSGCGAGTEYIAVSPEGDIYPCHQFVGNKKYLIGNLKDDQYKNFLYEQFNSAHIYNKEECRKCWAKFYCSGGCHANALNINGDIMKPYVFGCELERKRVKCAIGIKAELYK